MKRVSIIACCWVLALGCGRNRPADPDAVTVFVAPGEPSSLTVMGTPLTIEGPDGSAVADASVQPDSVADVAVDPVMEVLEQDVETVIPPENELQGTPPGSASAEEGARALLAAIKADDPLLADDFFFPAKAFDVVKAMENPGNYYKKLHKWYHEDIHAEHDRYWGVKGFEYDHLEMGACTWKEPMTQGNKIPYWSCRNTRLIAKSGTKLFDYRIKYMINWGASWHVIHLGPIRKI